MKLTKVFKKYIPYIAIIIAIVSLIQGNFLRRIGYSHIPEPYVILDEHTNVWHGLSIRKTGIPTAWSILSAYKDDAKRFGSGGGINGFNIYSGDSVPTLLGYRNVESPVTAVFEADLGNGTRHIPLVQPYLDHPPFGAFVLSLGVDSDEVSTFKDLSDYQMRHMSLYLAIITQILIAVLAYLLTKNYFVAIAASFTYATVPSFLLLSRYAQLENVLTPLILLSLVILVYLNSYKNKLSGKTASFLIAIAGVISGLAALTKISGWISVVLGIILLVSWKFEKKKILTFALPAVFLGCLYFLWGFYLSPRLFTDLFLYQGVSRGFIGSINLLVTMVKVNILNFPFDGWWIGGFLSLLLIPKDKKLLPLFVSVILVLFSALFLGGSNYPWYFIPLIPFMCISVGMFFAEVLSNPNVLNILMAFFVFASSSFYWGYGVFYAAKPENGYLQPFTLYRIIFLLVIFAILSLNRLKRTKYFKKIWILSVALLFGVLVLLNHHGMYYILDNWGKLPLLYTPGTF